MHIVDLYLYQWPPSLYRRGGVIPARRRFSAQYYNSSFISYSLSTTYRRRVSQLVGLGVVPLQVALAPLIRLSIQYISFSTGQSYTVDALYIAVTSIYTSSGGLTTSRFSIARSVLLQAPIILYRHQFYSFLRGARELFTSGLPLRPIPQIQAPYSIISLTTAIYSSRVRLKEGPQVNTTIYNTAIKAAAPLQVAYIIYAFQFSFISIQTPRTFKVVSSFILQPQILTIKARSLLALLFLIKQISQYLSSANLTLYLFAYAIHLLYAQFSLVQFSTTISPYIIRFISSINPRATISQLPSNVFRSLDIKNKNNISERGDPYRIPVGISIVSLSYPLNTILVERPIRNAQVNLVIQSGRPFFLRIYKSLLYNIQLKAPLISRLSIDTTQPRRACYAAQTLEVIRERAKRVNRFFLTPIYVYGSSPYASTASYIRSTIIFSSIFPSVFLRATSQQLPSREQSFLFAF